MFVILCVLASVVARDFAGYPNVRLATDASRDTLEKMLNDSYITSEGRGVFELVSSPVDVQKLSGVGQLEVVHHNVQELFDAEQRAHAAAPWKKGDPLANFFDAYRPYDDIIDFMDDIVANNNDIATQFSLGSTQDGNEVIRGIRLSGSARTDQPRVYLQGCVHAREWLAVSSILYTLYQLVEDYEANPQLLDSVQIYIVPVVNIDGYRWTWASNRMWRKNRRLNHDGSRGVDINRNWGPTSTWCTAGSSRTPSSDTYCGTSEFSESETASARSFMLDNANIKCGVDFHTFGSLLLWPYQYTFNQLPPPDYEFYQTLGSDMSDAIFAAHGERYVSQQGSQLYAHSGGMIDYAWDEHGIVALTFEGRGGGFAPPVSDIIPGGDEQYQAVLKLINTVIPPTE